MFDAFGTAGLHCDDARQLRRGAGFFCWWTGPAAPVIGPDRSNTNDDSAKNTFTAVPDGGVAERPGAGGLRRIK